jgi:hypothetical protein
MKNLLLLFIFHILDVTLIKYTEESFHGIQYKPNLCDPL